MTVDVLPEGGVEVVWSHNILKYPLLRAGIDVIGSSVGVLADDQARADCWRPSKAVARIIAGR